MDVVQRIRALRAEMGKEGIDVYLVPSSDFHQSEYVGDYFKVRQFLTGFTGSAGTAVFTQKKAGLWTDGRYFIQAEKELAGTGITLYKMGEPDCMTITEFLEEELPCGGTAGFDGRCVGVSEGKEYERIVCKKNGRLKYGTDLAERIWTDRGELPKEPAFLLEEKYSGESVEEKLFRVREKMAQLEADVHLLSSLDDIAWLLNIRGGDVAYCPLVLSYMLIRNDGAELFADEEKFPRKILERLERARVAVRPYDAVTGEIRKLSGGSVLLLDLDRVNYTLYREIPKGVRLAEAQNPEVLMKCRKNDTEIKNIREAHRKDAVAHTKFMYWLKTRDLEQEEITEISAARKLEEFRMEQENYVEASFEPISAFAEHGAIVHYSASRESNAVLSKGKMLLTDTGGHYMEGSTDITRTVALGEIPRREKEDFTLVARAMLRLMNTAFLKGCSGANLDCIAREVFWKERVNFNHGTGHGIGYLLNVHEAPINFRWKEGLQPAPCLEKNMLITDEPGLYIEGSHGIRLENVLLVCEDEKNEYGQFMHFEPLTYVPLDLDAILPERMTEEERGMLNAYHAQVRRIVSPCLEPDERAWLEEYTRQI